MLKPKQIILNCKLGTPVKNPAELTLDLKQHGQSEDVICLRVKLQRKAWNPFPHRRQAPDEAQASPSRARDIGNRELRVPLSLYRMCHLTSFLEELTALPDKAEGVATVWDWDGATDFLSFRKIAGKPDTIIFSCVSHEIALDGDYLLDTELPDVDEFLDVWGAGVALRGLLLTNEEVARLAQELQDFLASGE